MTLADAEFDAAVERLRLFHQNLLRAETDADQGTIDRAADLAALYADKRWVQELPEPKTKFHAGRPVDPASKSRFTKWIDEISPIKLQRVYVYRLLGANELVNNYVASGNVIQPAGESSVRPLHRLERLGHQHAIPLVWADAVDRAGGAAPEANDVKAAVSEYIAKNTPRTSRAKAAAINSARRAHEQAIANARMLIELGAFDEFNALISEIAALREQAIAKHDREEARGPAPTPIRRRTQRAG